MFKICTLPKGLIPLIACLNCVPALAQTVPASPGAPVTVNGEELFRVYERFGSFSAQDRARAIEARIESGAKDPLFSTESIGVTASEKSSNIVNGDLILVTFTDEDAKDAGLDRAQLANAASDKIKNAIVDTRKLKAPKAFWHGVLLTSLTSCGLLMILIALHYLFKLLHRRISNLSFSRIRPDLLKNLPSLNVEKTKSILAHLSTGLRVLLTLFVFIFYIPLVFSFFPLTANFAPTLFGYILNPLKSVFHVTLAYIPDFFFTIMILFVTRYFLKAIQFVFSKIESGTLKIEGFHQEWAQPTYKLVRVLVFALALVVVFPYLPGAKSPAFKGISVFLGVLFSLGSSSAISNLMSGIVLTYMRPFKIGDRVQISDTTGDVIEKSLLVTRIRTIKNVDITIPNAMVLSAHIINYSSAAESPGLILNTTITIGYDVPWKQVHGLLLEAASHTDLILKEPLPYVLQTSLDNSYVSYQINCFTHHANRMATIYSQLYQNIQDSFNRAQVEIMSPSFSAIRDGNSVTVPAENLKPKYQAPAFRFLNVTPK